MVVEPMLFHAAGGFRHYTVPVRYRIIPEGSMRSTSPVCRPVSSRISKKPIEGLNDCDSSAHIANMPTSDDRPHCAREPRAGVVNG